MESLTSNRPPRPFARAKGFAYWAREDLALLHYERAPNAEAIAALEAWGARLVHESAPPVRVLVLVERDAIDVDLSQRARMARVWRDFGPQIRSMAFVLLVDGFAGATARAVVTAMQALAKPSFAIRVFARCDDALRWQCPGEADLPSIMAWIAAARAGDAERAAR